MEEETTYGLTPEALARLLSIGMQGGRGPKNDAASRSAAEVLDDILSSPLPLDPDMPDSLPAVLNRPCDELLPSSGRAVSQILFDSKN